MGTYLTISQDVARESGTISGVLPTAVTGQTGRELRVVNWVRDAWIEIQNRRNSWLWRRKEFSFDLIVSQQSYTPAAVSLTNLSRWIKDQFGVTIYKTATGVSDEGELRYIHWNDWRRTYDRGTQTNNRPIDWTVKPDNQICFGPTPDAIYTVRGEYWGGVQTLTADADTPELPSEHHDVITYAALIKLADYDEAPEKILAATRRFNDLMFALERDQLPVIEINQLASTLA